MLDIIIKNGTVYDGTGSEPAICSIGISGDKITCIADIIEEDAKVVIDADGKCVSPGFVDIHSHSDYYLLIDPLAESKTMQGVTTEIGGNCGYSAAPIGGDVFDERKRIYRDEFNLLLDFTDLSGYFSRLEQTGTSVNFAAQIGQNTLRGSIMGHANRAPSTKELASMSSSIDKAMSDGAFGISVGLIYPPSCYAKTGELIHLCKVASKSGAVLSTHIRSEGRDLIDAIKEVIEICEKSEISLQISHLKTSGKQNWSKIDTVFNIIESAIDRGLPITCDRYPYTASNTGLLSALPEWVYEGGTKEILKRLIDQRTRLKIKKELSAIYQTPDDWKRVMISQVVTEKNKNFEGKNVRDGADFTNKECVDFVMDILIEEKNQIEAIYFSMCDENLERVLKKGYTMIGSDSGARAKSGSLSIGCPHPRTFGTFPRVLKKYSYEKKLFNLSTAIKKMTSDPCNKFNIRNRGLIKKGMFADIVIFDIEKVGDTSTYEAPFNYPTGIDFVIVNGELTVKKGESTGAKAGRPLRKE